MDQDPEREDTMVWKIEYVELGLIDTQAKETSISMAF